MQNYSSKFGNSQRSSLSPTKGGVNSIPPIQQNSMKNGYDENNNYNMSDDNKCETNYSIITKWNDVNTHINMQLTMHNKYTNDGRSHRRLRGAHIALSSHIARTLPHLMSSHTSLAQVLSLFITISMSSMAHSLWFDLSLLPLLFLPFLRRLLPPLRAALWARQPDRHGKPVLLRQQGEWGRLRRLHFLHRICTVILWERQFEKILLTVRLGEGFQLGNACSYTVKKGCSYLCMWMTSNWLERDKTLIRCWKVLNNKDFDLGEPTSFLDHVHLGVLKDNVKWAKIVDNYRTMFESRISAGATEKITMLGQSSNFFMLLRHGNSCQEMCGTILCVGKQDDSTTIQSINSLHWRPSLQRRRNEICWRIVTCMLTNCSKMSIFGTFLTTRYSMVSEQTWTINH